MIHFASAAVQRTSRSRQQNKLIRKELEARTARRLAAYERNAFHAVNYDEEIPDGLLSKSVLLKRISALLESWIQAFVRSGLVL